MTTTEALGPPAWRALPGRFRRTRRRLVARVALGSTLTLGLRRALRAKRGRAITITTRRRRAKRVLLAHTLLRHMLGIAVRARLGNSRPARRAPIVSLDSTMTTPAMRTAHLRLAWTVRLARPRPLVPHRAQDVQTANMPLRALRHARNAPRVSPILTVPTRRVLHAGQGSTLLQGRQRALRARRANTTWTATRPRHAPLARQGSTAPRSRHRARTVLWARTTMTRTPARRA